MVLVFISQFNSDTSAQSSPYYIGFASDLTGQFATLGIANKRGFDIAVNEVNAAGGVNGRKFVPIVYDNESNTAKAVINTKKLIDVDKVIALTGYGSSGTALSSMPVSEDNEIILFSAAASEKIWIPTRKWAFNVVPRQREASIPLLIDNLVKRGCKRIAYVYIDTVYGQTGEEAFAWAIKQKNIKPAIVEKYPPGSTDYSPQVTHIKAARADGILITGYVPDTVMLIKSTRENGFTNPIVSDYAIVGPEFFELAGKYAEGIVTTISKTVVAPDLPDTDPQKKVCLSFYTKYTKLHGEYSHYAGNLWDQVHMIAGALRRIDPKLDPTKDNDLKKIRTQVRDKIEKTKGFIGQNGIFNFSADNHNGLGPNSFVPVVVTEGKWRLYR